MGGLRVFLSFTKTFTPRWWCFEFTPRIETRVEEFTNWHDHKRNFHFCLLNCPETCCIPFDDGYAYLRTKTSEEYPFYKISRNRIRELVDEWFIKNGIDAGEGWIG